MITPIEIQNKVFKSGGLGYDKKDVEQFMHEVLQSFEIIYRENMMLTDKVSALSEGIQYYKAIEKTLQRALVLAEKTAEDMKSNALREAQQIETDAKTKAQLILVDAARELEVIHQKTIALAQEYERFKLQIKNAARTQIELMDTSVYQIPDADQLREQYRNDSQESIAAASPVFTELSRDAEKAAEDAMGAPNYKQMREEFEAAGQIAPVVTSSKKRNVPAGQEEFSYIDLSDEEA